MPAALSLTAPEFGIGSPDPMVSARSLFILSLPRSLSSLVHRTCCDALGLRAPSWTSDGEIMNVERSVFLSDHAHGAKYSQAHQPHLFGPATEFLSEIVQPRGFCYKDVTQPFVMAAWLRQRSDLHVLKIVPNIAHSALAMLRRNWLYPTMAARPGGGDLPKRLVAGLVKAAAAIEAVPGESIAFDDLVNGPEGLRDALSRLYPEAEIRPLDFGPDFAAGRAEVLQRRNLPVFRELDALVHDIVASSPIGVS